MKTLCIIVFYIFFLSLFCLDQVSPISIYTLTPSQSLKDGQNLTSQSETFDLGFFSPSANSRNRYLGIWYKKVPLQTVVWVANRESPLNDSSGVLMISSTGNLVILNGRNHTIWSTNSSKIAENPIIEFLESGNLILRDRNSDEYLWQSFHHPSDTFLPSMKLGSDTSIGMNNYLTSWKSSDDPSPGDYTYGVNLNPYPELSMRNRSNKFYRSGPWNGLRNSGQPELNNNASFVYKDDADDKKAYFTFQLVSKDFITRLTLTQIGNTGELQRLSWVVNRSQNWVQDYQIPRDQCDNYGHCGVGSICDTHEVPRCKCLRAFEPTSPLNWNEWDWSRGCQRKTPLNCDKGDGFIKCTEVKLPDTTNTWLNMSMSLEECKDKCLKNCSCMAYANSDIQKNGTGCAMWFIDLIDIRKLSGAGQDLYIRVAASDAAIDESNETESDPASNKKQTTIIVISISVILIIFLIALLRYIIRKKKVIENITKDSAEQRVHKDQIQDPPVYDMFLHARKEFPGENNDDLELNFFEMDTIVKATYNFSNTNMLGQGGFGCVYKGTLEDGQIIAVKRLSKNSGQGVDEFKNEVMLIARLQHRNLVRLLGYCVEWEEKILVYEYMENKGLDAILFNKAFKIILDWPKRFNIVIGISRGLLYLHQDSRFRIIHRDLKTSNVLLDGDLNPKISDFGMARIFGGDETEAKTKRVVGTYGYMSPEYAMDGLFSVKSDVFSFGVLVLEIISGTKNKGFFSSNSQHNLLGYAWRLWKEGQEFDLIDETVKDSCMQNEALRCIHIGLLCVQERAEDRPTMSSVVLMLSTDTALPEPKEPGFWFGKSPDKTNSASSKRKLHSVNDVTVTLLEAR